VRPNPTSANDYVRESNNYLTDFAGSFWEKMKVRLRFCTRDGALGRILLLYLGNKYCSSSQALKPLIPVTLAEGGAEYLSFYPNSAIDKFSIFGSFNALRKIKEKCHHSSHFKCRQTFGSRKSNIPNTVNQEPYSFSTRLFFLRSLYSQINKYTPFENFEKINQLI